MNDLHGQLTEHHKDNEFSVKLVDLEEMLDSAEKEEQVFHRKAMVVCYLLRSGFTVIGKSSVVNPEKFKIEFGRKLCREDALKQMWLLEGYLVQQRLSDHLHAEE